MQLKCISILKGTQPTTTIKHSASVQQFRQNVEKLQKSVTRHGLRLVPSRHAIQGCSKHADQIYQSQSHATSHIAQTAQAPHLSRSSSGSEQPSLQPKQKRPAHANWPEREFTSKDFRPNSGIGIVTGHGIVALDVDAYCEDVSAAIAAEAIRHFGD